jgi:hypothetical protein
MIRKRSVIGLSLLSMLAVVAFGASSASAAWETATNTTAVTCAPNGGSKDFKDAHCKESVTPGTGGFGHVAIANGVKTAVESTNITTGEERQVAVLTGEALFVKVTITCKKVGPGAEPSFLENTSSGGTNMDVNGTSSVKFTECTQTGLGASCKVKEPIGLNTFVKGVKEPTEKNMALEFTPDPAGNPYVVIEFEGSCLVSKTEVTGTARGTVEGATINFEAKHENLKAFGNAATFTGKFTTRMTENGNPISMTTN